MTQFKAEADAALKESKKHFNKLAKFLELIHKQATEDIEVKEYEAHSAVAEDLKRASATMRTKIGSMQAVVSQATRAAKKKKAEEEEEEEDDEDE